MFIRSNSLDRDFIHIEAVAEHGKKVGQDLFGWKPNKFCDDDRVRKFTADNVEEIDTLDRI